MSSFTDINAQLSAAFDVSSITDLLGDYESGHALFNGVVIPQDCKALNTINYYQTGSIDLAASAVIARFSINCRAETEGEAHTIAHAVAAAVNRVSFVTYYMTVNYGQAIPPADDTDAYNVPLEITFKQR